MRIRIWNAYASNNSGSYTIVGRFDSEETAAAVAAELLAVVKAQSAWVEADAPPGPSPLSEFAAQNGLAEPDGGGAGENWPEHSQQEHPQVWTVQSQLFLHSDYQVSMPRTFGELIYARGGRVEFEVDHAHHPMAALFELHWPWKGKTKDSVAAGVQQVLRTLHADAGFAANEHQGLPPHAWRAGRNWMEPDLRIGATFDDLVAGFAAIDAAARAAGAHVTVRVFENLSDQADPFPALRPNHPPFEG